jgi:hypothetical protein
VVVKCVYHALGCTWVGPLGDQATHLDTKCLKRARKCPFSAIGCSHAKVRVVDLERHKAEYAMEHARCIRSEQIRMRRDYEHAVRQTLQAQEHEVVALQQTLDAKVGTLRGAAASGEDRLARMEQVLRRICPPEQVGKFWGGAAGGHLHGTLYAIAGCGEGGVLDTMERYDVATDTWGHHEGCGKLSQARAYHAAVWYRGQIYVTGGRDGSGHMLRSMEAHHPSPDLTLPPPCASPVPSLRRTTLTLACGILPHGSSRCP